MLFLLSNWKCLLKIGAAVFFTILFTYACYLSNKVDSLKSDNKQLSNQIAYTTGYIKKYENIKKENEALSLQLTSILEGQKDDPKCLAPEYVRNVINRMH